MNKQRLTEYVEDYLEGEHWKQEALYLEKADYEMILKALKAQPEQQWIPCSERLPKTKSWRTYFIVTTEAGFTTVVEWENTTIRGKEVSRWICHDKICPFDVIAWMPLPAPMKGERE